jgi:hypothetical protein
MSRVLATIAAVLLATGMINGCGKHGLPYAESALQWAMPDPWSASGQYLGMSRFTAAELNRVHQGSGWGRIDFVDGDLPSTRPDQVSVNPIDDYTWTAAAHSARDGRCYVIASVVDRQNPRDGNTFYGRLPVGTRCVGDAATLAVATATSALPEG